jgi:hypothetical protein
MAELQMGYAEHFPDPPDKQIERLDAMCKRLPELRRTCEAVLVGLAKLVREGVDALSLHACVNWADLHCMRAEAYVDDGGNVGFRVLLEEADPENHELQIAVSQELDTRGFQDVYVETAW